MGYHRYRCINASALATYDQLFALNSQNGVQTGAVLWSAPRIYTYAPNCTGFVNNGQRIYDGCVPRDDAMDDWEDYVNLLATRYSSSSSNKISHFIIWNENNNGSWFDYSPVVPSTSNGIALTTTQVNQWTNKYSSMLSRAYAAVQRHSAGVMVDVSINSVFLSQSPTPGNSYDIGASTLLNALWASIGTSLDWGIATHPYTDPTERSDPNFINFQNEYVLAQFQKTHLRQAGVQNPDAAPQSRLFADEQGWLQGTTINGQYSNEIEWQSRNICEAHEISTRNLYIIAEAHNTFQDSTDGPASFGLVRATAGRNLAGAPGMQTWEAYKATGPSSWRQNDTNYCCANYKLGCTSAKPYTFVSSFASETLSGWDAAKLIDGDPTTNYSSNSFRSSSNDRGAYVVVWLPGRNVDGWRVSRIDLKGRNCGDHICAFPLSYDVSLSDPTNSSWRSVGTFYDQPDINGLVSISLPAAYRTFAIKVTPITLSLDGPGGNYYFQLAEISAYSEGVTANELSYTMGTARAANGNSALYAIDDDNSTSYSSSSVSDPTSLYLASWPATSDAISVSGVRLTPSMVTIGGLQAPTKFPIAYNIYVTTSDNSSWNLVGQYKNQPAAINGAWTPVVVTFPRRYVTHGVMIIPTYSPCGQLSCFSLAEFGVLP